MTRSMQPSQRGYGGVPASDAPSCQLQPRADSPSASLAARPLPDGMRVARRASFKRSRFSASSRPRGRAEHRGEGAG
jgi:hypothetical protein